MKQFGLQDYASHITMFVAPTHQILNPIDGLTYMPWDDVKKPCGKKVSIIGYFDSKPTIGVVACLHKDGRIYADGFKDSHTWIAYVVMTSESAKQLLDTKTLCGNDESRIKAMLWKATETSKISPKMQAQA